MIDSLCDYNDGILVDEVYQLIEAIVAEKYQIETEDLVEEENDNNTLIYKEIYQDEINTLYDEFEDSIINFLNW